MCCLTCAVRREHGGKLDKKATALSFFLLNQAVNVGYVRKWRDPNGFVWWLAVLLQGDGDLPVPFTAKAQAYRTVNGGTVMPLFASPEDARGAVLEAFGLAVDA